MRSCLRRSSAKKSRISGTWDKAAMTALRALVLPLGSLRDGFVGGGLRGRCGRVACKGGRPARRRFQRLDRLCRTKTAIAPTAAEATRACHGSTVGATCAPLVRTKSGPVRVGTSAPVRRPRLRSPAVSPGRWRSLRDGFVGGGLRGGHGTMAARRRSRTASIGPVAHGIPPPWPPSSAADACKNRTHILS